MGGVIERCCCAEQAEELSPLPVPEGGVRASFPSDHEIRASVKSQRSTAKDLSMPSSKVVPEDQKPRPRRRPRFPFCCGSDAADDLHGTGSAAVGAASRGAKQLVAPAADEQTGGAGCDNAEDDARPRNPWPQ